MILRFCTLVSGSSGNSSLVAAGSTKILVDSGRSGKHIESCLRNVGTAPEELDCILVTHEHIDHTASVGIMSRRYNIPIYTTYGTWEGMQNANMLGRIDEANKNIINSLTPFVIKDIEITAFPIPHDAAEPVGYIFKTPKACAVVATDMGYLCDEAKDALYGADIVLLESNYDIDMLQNGGYPYPLKQRILGANGHLSNKDSALFAVRLAESGTRHIVLGHLSQQNNTPECAMSEVAREFASNGIKIGRDVNISVAPRHGAGELIAL
jgi:phosphoribosyl 1,2-cyclic phosphodiesterase